MFSKALFLKVVKSQNRVVKSVKMFFLKTEILLGMDRKHCGKRKKCCLPAFSPFPTMSSKAVFVRSLKVGIVWQVTS